MIIVKHLPPALLENRQLLRYLLRIMWKLPNIAGPMYGNWPKFETGTSRTKQFLYGGFTDSADPSVRADLRTGSTATRLLELWFRSPQELGRFRL